VSESDVIYDEALPEPDYRRLMKKLKQRRVTTQLREAVLNEIVRLLHIPQILRWIRLRIERRWPRP